MERIDRSGSEGSSGISEKIFRISIHAFLRLFLFYANLLSAPAWRWVQLCKLQGAGIEQDCKRLIASVAGSPTVVRGAQSLWQNPSEIHPETPENSPSVDLSTCQLSMPQVINTCFTSNNTLNNWLSSFKLDQIGLERSARWTRTLFWDVLSCPCLT